MDNEISRDNLPIVGIKGERATLGQIVSKEDILLRLIIEIEREYDITVNNIIL